MKVTAKMNTVLTHPGYAASTVIRSVYRADERQLGKIVGAGTSQIYAALREPLADRPFQEHLVQCSQQVQPPGWLRMRKTYLMIYAIVRLARPQIIVETGVANGLTSSLILLALAKNQAGHLHSIELKESSWTSGKPPGWVIPQTLRDRWTLHLGDAKATLPALLQQLNGISIFLHDSDHSYGHMTFELREALPHLAPGGLALADDARNNSAFLDFAIAHKAQRYGVIRGLGVMRA